MIRDAKWKLLYVPARKGVKYMLYDVLADRSETRDVAADHQDVVNAMRGTLWQWMLEDSRMVERGGYLVTRDAPDAENAGSSALRIP